MNSVCLSIYLSMNSVCLSIYSSHSSIIHHNYLSIYLSIVYLSMNSIYPSHPSIIHHNYLSIYELYLSIPSIRHPSQLSIYLSVCELYLSIPSIRHPSQLSYLSLYSVYHLSTQRKAQRESPNSTPMYYPSIKLFL